jgi:DNA-binding CsgD family transcriptional regulator
VLAAVHAASQQFAMLPKPLGLGEVLEDRAVLLAETGDLAGARADLDEALACCQRLGAAWDILRGTSRMRRFGIRLGQRGPRRRPKSGWDALTPSESKVAQLVAHGQSNPDIAAELQLSRRTVQTRVSHILGKLGVSSRVEIAREATRHAPSGVAAS